MTKELPHEAHMRHSDILLNGHGGILMKWLLDNSTAMCNIIINDLIGDRAQVFYMKRSVTEGLLQLNFYKFNLKII